ncbi:MAG: ABC transporter permease [Actinomycetota bacterium]
MTDTPAANTETSAGSDGLSGARLSRGTLIRRRFLRNKLAIFGVAVMVFMFVLAFVGPYLTKWTYTDNDFENLLSPPSGEHWFGTTQVGVDVFAQTMRGLQKSLIVGLLVGIFSTSLSALVGSVAGYLGGRTDRILMTAVDLLLVIPSFLVLVILSRYYQGKSWLLLVVGLTIFDWMISSRVVRGETQRLRDRDFVRAARYIGVPTSKIILRHLLPNYSSILVIMFVLNIGGAVLGETTLSYLGFGVQAPDVSLGTLIAEGTGAALTYPWLFHFAGASLILTVLAASFVGDGLRDAFDPGSAKSKKI